MNEFESQINNEENENLEPSVQEIFAAVEKDIDPEDLESMKNECENDIEMTLGAIFTYMIEIKGMTEDETEEYLIEKGILE